MENTKLQQAQPMELEAQAIVYLNETRKWTLFLAILGFIFLGFMLLGAISYGVIFSSLPELNAISNGLAKGMGIGVSVFMIVIIAIWFFPLLYLYKFSIMSKKAILENNNETLTVAFRYLKMYYRFIGIFAIVVLSLYVIMFLIAIVGGVVAAIVA